jgi:arylsulfatase
MHARTIHRPAWQFKPSHSLQEDLWELYNTNGDFSLANNLAASNADKLKEMQGLFGKRTPPTPRRKSIIKKPKE